MNYKISSSRVSKQEGGYKMRLWSRSVVILVVLLVINGVVVAAADRIVIYTNIDREHIQRKVEAFNKVHPEISVEIFRAPIEELFTILELELMVGQLRADIVAFGDLTRAELFKENGWIQPFKIPEEELPFFEDSFIDPDGYWVPYGADAMLIHFNLNFVSREEAPKSWLDLLNERFKDKIVMGCPRSTGMVHVAIRYIADILYEKYGEPYGWSYFEELAKLNPMTVSGHRTVRDLIAIGEKPIGILTTGGAYPSVFEGEATGYNYMVEGTPAAIQAYGIVTGTRNKAAAEAFVNWVISREGQILTSKVTGFLPVRNDVPLDLPYGETLEDVNPVLVHVTPEVRAYQAEKFYEIVRQ